MRGATVDTASAIPGLLDPAPASDERTLVAIRAHNDQTAAWVVVLDDDPTGAQAVHDVEVLVEPTVANLARLAMERQPTFIWTNSRSKTGSIVHELNKAHVRDAIEAARQVGVRPVFVSRSDSTLRGHFSVELDAVKDACRDAGISVDGVVFVPAFPEAGRFTVHDTQWVTQADGSVVAAADTEFARDATFGYHERSLRDWISHRTHVSQRDVKSVQIDELRHGVADAERTLLSLSGGEVAIGNATGAGDLEMLAQACQAAERGGRRLIYRTGPSFVRALVGQAPRSPLITDPSVLRQQTTAGGHGLTVVGSHTALSTHQLNVAHREHGLSLVNIEVDELLHDPDETIAVASADLVSALGEGDAALVTSRTVRTATGDPEKSLTIARRISDAVCEVISSLPPDLALCYVVAKGGITSHEVAVRGLGMRSATVLGQMLPGQVSVLRLGPETARPGLPYVVFPGNVGEPDTLSRVITTVGGEAR